MRPVGDRPGKIAWFQNNSSWFQTVISSRPEIRNVTVVRSMRHSHFASQGAPHWAPVMGWRLRTRAARSSRRAADPSLPGRRRMRPSVRRRKNGASRRRTQPELVREPSLDGQTPSRNSVSVRRRQAPTTADRSSLIDVPSISQQVRGATTSSCVLVGWRSATTTHTFGWAGLDQTKRRMIASPLGGR